MPKILLVEDDEISSLVLSSILEDGGYEVRKAADFAAAIASGTSEPPQLLITDWKLDGIHTGKDVAEALSQSNPSLKVIFISGRERDDIVAETQNLNVVAVISKPCDFDEVLAVSQKHAPT
ncbi:MAG: response regulator [Deltaproteobacteria bacterium]|nr:response regulator [Deltaproteobacteria bacterium]